MQTIELSPEVSAVIEKLQESSTVDVRALVHDTAETAIQSLLEQLREDRLQKEQEAFEALYPQLIATHHGHYVAIYQGNVIDSDIDQRTLFVRVHQRHPNSTIGIFQVSEQARNRVHRFTGHRVLSTTER